MPVGLPMDLHTHSEHSHDADYPVIEMCEAALKAGIGVFAIADHYDVNNLDPDFSFLDKSMKRSVNDTLAAKDLYQGKIEMLTGIELGQPLEKPGKADEILVSYPFDFVLGSLHNAPGRLDIYYYNRPGDTDLFNAELEAYFAALLEMIRWGRFDAAAHITYPFRFISPGDRENYPFGRWDDYLETAVKTLAEKGLALEVNTNHPSYTLPGLRWVKRFRELGGEKLTLGSDAHSPRRVGNGIDAGMRTASDAGFAYLCYFVGREPRYIKLSDYL